MTRNESYFPNDVLASELMENAKLLMLERRRSEARDVLTQLIELDGVSPRVKANAHGNRGICWRDDKQVDKALAELGTAIAMVDPKSRTAQTFFLVRAEILEPIDVDLAAEDYQRLRDFAPYPDFRAKGGLGLALIFKKQANFDQAWAELDKVWNDRDASPLISPRAAFYMATTKRESGEFAVALDYALKAWALLDSWVDRPSVSGPVDPLPSARMLLSVLPMLAIICFIRFPGMPASCPKHQKLDAYHFFLQGERGAFAEPRVLESIFAYDLGCQCAILGLPDDMAEWWRFARREDAFPDLEYIRADPRLAPFLDGPWFAEALRR